MYKLQRLNEIQFTDSDYQRELLVTQGYILLDEMADDDWEISDKPEPKNSRGRKRADVDVD